ncbi:hypothetical protein GCM10023188_44950 [Pontibacter saemangeumensis]|uniref:Uncharacterized protein n=1 Tax=Pontibacter saemangeumensis TaxID=1084525 RepID=A0ABP8M4S1_9BACT
MFVVTTTVYVDGTTVTVFETVLVQLPVVRVYVIVWVPGPAVQGLNEYIPLLKVTAPLFEELNTPPVGKAVNATLL